MKTQHIMHKTGLRLMMVLLSFFVLTGCDGRTPKPSTSQIKEMAQNLKVGSLIFRVGSSRSADNWRSSPAYDVSVVSKIDGDDVSLGSLIKAEIDEDGGYVDENGKKIPARKRVINYLNTSLETYEALKKSPYSYASIYPIYDRGEDYTGVASYVEPLIVNATKPVYFYHTEDGMSYLTHYSKKAIIEKGVLDRCVEGRPYPSGLGCGERPSDTYVEKIIAP